ncbi:galactonate dehydratase [Saccharopolyspora sp. K220]|uniref:galactonate dehydratase n=1 Tax=Saccharopolyspora soli TaxID=2926618 RepID=UPI001F57CA7F|nr:galactonate dehydratase [Saccharopolyspora soli]MCI2419715.1 galactonate dehydratase [Saccharopolyspora soli]
MSVPEGPPIRITAVETTVVNAEMRNWILVKVRTDTDGLHGWGEASLNWKTRAVLGAIEDLSSMIVGRDPRDIEQLVRIMTKHSYYRLGIIGATAISGIEHALWDILGKSLGQPVWRLLGGRVRDSVRVYTHLGLGDMRSVYDTVDIGQAREKAAAVVEQGYDALKVVLVPYGHHLTVAAERRHVDKLMDALRDTVGPDVDIMIDFHGRTASIAAALQYIDVLAPYDPLFCEEPVQPGDTDALREVTRRARTPIAAGERLVGLREFLPVLAAKAVHVAQPDLNHTGGLLEGKRIAAVADAELVGIAPHNPNGPIAGAAALHFDVSTPNFLIQEEMSGAVSWYDDVVRTPMRRVDGHWQVPTEPGLGVEVDEREAAKHPYQPEVPHSGSAVLADGTVVDW